jgi:hypothetical protein
MSNAIPDPPKPQPIPPPLRRLVAEQRSLVTPPPGSFGSLGAITGRTGGAPFLDE